MESTAIETKAELDGIVVPSNSPLDNSDVKLPKETKAEAKSTRATTKANKSKGKSKTFAYKVTKAYPGHEVGEIITLRAESAGARRNVANGYWEIVK